MFHRDLYCWLPDFEKGLWCAFASPPCQDRAPALPLSLSCTPMLRPSLQLFVILSENMTSPCPLTHVVTRALIGWLAYGGHPHWLQTQFCWCQALLAVTTCARMHAGRTAECVFGIVHLCVQHVCVCVCCVCEPVQGYIGQMSEAHLPAEIPGKMSKSVDVQSFRSIVQLDIKASSQSSIYLEGFNYSRFIAFLYYPLSLCTKTFQHFYKATVRHLCIPDSCNCMKTQVSYSLGSCSMASFLSGDFHFTAVESVFLGWLSQPQIFTRNRR